MLIVLEGLDGAGKSTQINYLKEYFTNIKMQVEYLHFPRFDSPVYGGLIARFLRGDFGAIDKVDPVLVALLYAGDRGDAAQMIKNWLSKKYIVILDRYIYSNIAFQCAKVADPVKREELRNWIFESEFGYFGIPVPDVNLFLDVPLSFVGKKLAEEREGEEREYLQGKRDIHEADITFQERVRNVYLDECSREGGLVRIECAGNDGGIATAGIIFEKVKIFIENSLI
jgi:dTMP kinase